MKKSKRSKAFRARRGFSEEEGLGLCAHELSVKAPFRALYAVFPIGTRAWVIRAKAGNLELEVYHTNLSGSNRHHVTVDKRKFKRHFQDHGLNYKSPAPEIGHL